MSSRDLTYGEELLLPKKFEIYTKFVKKRYPCMPERYYVVYMFCGAHIVVRDTYRCFMS